DVVIEATNEGNDRVASSISYALAATSAIERLEAIDLASTTAIDLTGNDFGNLLLGNDGVNILRGGGGGDSLAGVGGDDFLDGGSGADSMEGGAGNDTYFVDNAGDTIIESAGGGTDRLAANISYVLTSGSPIERLEAVTLASTDALDYTGNEFGQLITGNNGVNILRGDGGDDRLEAYGGNDFLDGGTGNDTMFGGLGNDTYYVDSSGDIVLEDAGQGSDRIATSVSYTLAAGVSVENLEAITQSATTPINLTGNEFDNILVGNDGANILQSGGGNDTIFCFGGDDAISGGSGNDLIDGGAGSDRFVVNGPAEGYKITTTSTNIIIQDTDPSNGDDGTDTLVNVEQIQFGGVVSGPGPAGDLAHSMSIQATPIAMPQHMVDHFAIA
ncbi:MAG TPA: calcium-binding protein, partial [Pseudolabrys sp.]|nr:calcium-binding protein [Pseudolabrys sp.]